MGRGDNPGRYWNVLQNALLLRVSALWMGSAVNQIDDAREAQLSMRAWCCCARFSGLLPIVEVGNGPQAAGGGGSRGVSLGLRQDCAQVDVINDLPAGVGEPYTGTELGPLLAEACAGTACGGWPALVGWRFLCVCAFDAFLL